MVTSFIIKKKCKGARGQGHLQFHQRNENYSSNKTHHWQCRKLTHQTSTVPVSESEESPEDFDRSSDYFEFAFDVLKCLLSCFEFPLARTFCILIFS